MRPNLSASRSSLIPLFIGLFLLPSVGLRPSFAADVEISLSRPQMAMASKIMMEMRGMNGDPQDISGQLKTLLNAQDPRTPDLNADTVKVTVFIAQNLTQPDISATQGMFKNSQDPLASSIAQSLAIIHPQIQANLQSKRALESLASFKDKWSSLSSDELSAALDKVFLNTAGKQENADGVKAVASDGAGKVRAPLQKSDRSVRRLYELHSRAASLNRMLRNPGYSGSASGIGKSRDDAQENIQQIEGSSSLLKLTSRTMRLVPWSVVDSLGDGRESIQNVGQNVAKALLTVFSGIFVAAFAAGLFVMGAGKAFIPRMAGALTPVVLTVAGWLGHGPLAGHSHTALILLGVIGMIVGSLVGGVTGAFAAVGFKIAANATSDLPPSVVYPLMGGSFIPAVLALLAAFGHGPLLGLSLWPLLAIGILGIPVVYTLGLLTVALGSFIRSR